MAESRGITIRFPQQLFDAIQRCADARKLPFAAVVVETCSDRLTKHGATISDRVKVLEQEVVALKKALSDKRESDS